MEVVYKTPGIDLSGVADGLFGIFSNSQSYANFYSFIVNAWEVYSVIAFLISAVFIFGIIYSYIRIGQLDEQTDRRHLAAEKMWQEVYGGHAGNTQWAQVQTHSESNNPNDWKLAIIEADIMLEKVLRDAGYAGNTIGEMLKSATPTSFTTLQDAWDAHIIRNKIAHQGEEFVLTHRIAREAIIKYQKVFQEFQVV